MRLPPPSGTGGIWSPALMLCFCVTAFAGDLSFDAAVAAAVAQSTPEMQADLMKLASAHPRIAVEILAKLQQSGETKHAALGLLHRNPYIVEHTCAIIKDTSDQSILPYAYQALESASRLRGKMGSEVILQLRKVRTEVAKVIERLTGKSPEIKLDPTLREAEELTLELMKRVDRPKSTSPAQPPVKQ